MTSRDYPPTTPLHGITVEGEAVLSALFRSESDAEGAIGELRDCGIRPENISVITRDEDHPVKGQGAAGASREEIGDEALTYRAASELPNDEELPTTTAAMTTRGGLRVSTDVEVPPDEPMGGSDQLGITRDRDLVRRNEADANADEDIYTDFPDQPGGVNPKSPVAPARQAEATEQERMEGRTQAGGNAAAGAGLGAVAGFLVGLTALAVPGAGPFLAAGPLALALGGVAAGGATGGIVGALSGIGVPEEYARHYVACIEQGQTLVSVRTDAVTADLVERVLTAHRGEEIH